MKKLLLIFSIISLFASAQESKQLDMYDVKYHLPDTVNAVQWYSEIETSNTGNFYGITFNNGSLGLYKKGKMKTIEYNLHDNVNDKKIIVKGINIKEIKNKLTWKYNWEGNSNYKVLITTIIDSSNSSSYYTSYVYLTREQQWKLLGSYKVNNRIGYIKNLTTINGNSPTAANNSIGKTSWIQRENGSWKELNEITITRNNIAKKKSNEDDEAPPPILLLETSTRPVFSVTNHIDSSVQSIIDNAEIQAAVRSGKIDTTGVIKNVYYKTIKEGTGDYVNITDTLTVFYKGSLLKDGSVFDSTKDKPATFPLARLIKGWQYGLTKCRVGGKIRLFIPSGLAYSIRSRSKDIPPNSVLVFDVEVLSAKKAG